MSRTRNLWKVYLAVGVAASLAYHFFPSAKWGLSISALSAAVATAAIVIGVRLHRPARTLPWYVLAGTPAFFCVGYLIAQGYVLVTGVYPIATAADIFWNLGDLSLALGLVLLLCRRENSRTSLLDVGIIALAVSQIAWVELIMDYAQTNQLSVAVRTTQITYGVLDVLVLALLCRIVVSAGSRRGSFALVAAGGMAVLAADSAFNWLTLTSAYTAATAFDFGWMLASVLIATAALHPSMGALFPSEPSKERRVQWSYVGLLIAAALVAPALLIGGAAFDNHAARGVLIFIAITSGALVLLVIARMIGFVRVAERSIRLAEHNKRLIELDAVKDDVIAIVSHELRTPLTSIVGYLEFVLEDPDALTKEQQKFLGVVDRNANRLLGLVSDLLFVAQVQAGRMALEKDALNFPELVREAVAAALPSATERRVQIDLNRCDGETEILGDRKRLAQVVDNLLSNALKFTPAGGVVEVRLLAEDESVALEVADTGIGIPAAEQQKLFTRFFRTEAAMKKAIQGTGLGLSIVKAIVEGHGGEITVVSAANRGATFRVVLPRAAAVAPESFREAA